VLDVPWSAEAWAERGCSPLSWALNWAWLGTQHPLSSSWTPLTGFCPFFMGYILQRAVTAQMLAGLDIVETNKPRVSESPETDPHGRATASWPKSHSAAMAPLVISSGGDWDKERIWASVCQTWGPRAHFHLDELMP
jgi:hypothetical protein